MFSHRDAYLAEKLQTDNTARLHHIYSSRSWLEIAAHSGWAVLRRPLRGLGYGLIAITGGARQPEQTPTTHPIPQREALQRG